MEDRNLCDDGCDDEVLGDVRFSVKEVALIGEVVRECSGLSRMELARTVCELLRWRRPNGRLKARECREFLERLDADGALVGSSAESVGRIGFS